MKHTNIEEIVEKDDKWDTGELGREEEWAKAVELSEDQQRAIDDAIGLQMISIRLPKALIEDFKFLGEVNGIKYQTLMRQILARFAECEKKNIAKKAAGSQLKAARKEMEAPDAPAARSKAA